MTILHNPFDKTSREFVDLYGAGNDVLEYPGCVAQYPFVSAFPSVVIPVPAYYDTEAGQNVDASEYLMRLPNDWTAVETIVSELNQRAVDNPPQ